MADQCRIAIVDPYPLFRSGAVQAISRDKDLVVVAEGRVIEDALRFVRKKALDIILLEAALPGSLDVADSILQTHLYVKVVFLASIENQEHATQALQGGAVGYIMKGISGPELVGAIKAIHGGQQYMTPDLACRLLKKPETLPTSGTAYLSTREQQVIDETLKGLTNQEIAHIMGLTVSTIKYYKSLAFKKMGVRNRIEAALATNKIMDVKLS